MIDASVGGSIMKMNIDENHDFYEKNLDNQSV